ncbi:MAG: CehA/McbA family metallohydrolase [Bryobacteraceae bacterium]
MQVLFYSVAVLYCFAMGYGPHLSRREIFNAIPVLGSGAVLLPPGGRTAMAPNAVIRGALKDAATGRPVAAKLSVTAAATGESYMPASSIKTMPQKVRTGAVRYFYARGSYEVAVPPGRYRIEVVRGICHEPGVAEMEAKPGAAATRDFALRPLWDLRQAGWYSGNTHTHYNVEIEESVDDRLRLVPAAEAVDVSVISYLIRKNLPYPSNRIPIGRLPRMSDDGPILDMGEECRNNSPSNSIPGGYGHCLFLNIPRLIEPVSTGMLSPDPGAPDFPTLSMLCEQAKRAGGTTVWCHNGNGLESPVAVALGHVDALNISDSAAVDYNWYYQLLHCGFRLPISTGTDWWEYDHNRVFVQVQGEFRYESWLAGLRAGRTFISNGPLLQLEVNGAGPGSEAESAKPLRVSVRALSRVPFERVEIVCDGEVVASQTAEAGQEAKLEREIPAAGAGWIAARVAGDTSTRLGYPVFAHTNPVYIRGGGARRRAEAARAMIARIEEGIRTIRKACRFAGEADQAIALGRFEQGKQYYARLL